MFYSIIIVSFSEKRKLEDTSEVELPQPKRPRKDPVPQTFEAIKPKTAPKIELKKKKEAVKEAKESKGKKGRHGFVLDTLVDESNPTKGLRSDEKQKDRTFYHEHDY